MSWIIYLLILVWLFAEGISEAYRTKAKDMRPYKLDFHSWRLIHRGAISLVLLMFGYVHDSFLVILGGLIFGNFLVYERSRSKFYRGKWFPHFHSYKHYHIMGKTLKWNSQTEIILGLIGLVFALIGFAIEYNVDIVSILI